MVPVAAFAAGALTTIVVVVVGVIILFAAEPSPYAFFFPMPTWAQTLVMHDHRYVRKPRVRPRVPRKPRWRNRIDALTARTLSAVATHLEVETTASFAAWWGETESNARKRLHHGRHRAAELHDHAWRERWAKYPTADWPTLVSFSHAETLTSGTILENRPTICDRELREYADHTGRPRRFGQVFVSRQDRDRTLRQVSRRLRRVASQGAALRASSRRVRHAVARLQARRGATHRL